MIWILSILAVLFIISFIDRLRFRSKSFQKELDRGAKKVAESRKRMESRPY